MSTKRTAKSVKWSKLSPVQQQAVARKLGGAALTLAGRAHFGKGYEVVNYPFSRQRRPSVVELNGEDDILRGRDRNRIINMHRDMMRNSPTRVAQDQQIRVNVVGKIGGKLYANFPAGYEDAAAQVTRWINRIWARHCEFTFGESWNWVLKTCLTSQDSNGNVILIFDDGFLTGGFGSGKIRAFEGDEIANIPDKIFTKRFPGCTQSQGFVYDRHGRWIGAFVSSAQRGAEEFKVEDGFLFLPRDPASFEPTENWIALGDMRRFNQGRAISPLTAAINCLVDLHEITASETLAAKTNAQLLGQVLSDATAPDPSANMPAGFTDEPEAEALPETVEFSMAELKSIGVHFDQLPQGMKLELLDTKRPNANMPAYIEFLTGLAGGARGLARVYATLKAQTSYTAFRGEQVMTFPTFEEMQKDLERKVCDPMVRKAIRWGIDHGYITAALPEEWEDMLAFSWPKMREVSEKDAQEALALKLANGVTTLHRELGPGEYDAILAERQKEVEDFKRLGIAYPGSPAPTGSANIEEPTKEEEDEQ